uniref:Ulp1 protease-like n=1 Tax=Oryza sativa subsp. japonica TaxID=39947 RepID=Q5Z7R1_ORYSJ|nr:Ulp1 protease-like [Oryza sativa Japonica Group]
MEGVPGKERQPEFYMETTRTTRIGDTTNHETINTITTIGTTTSSTPNTINIQANIRQDTPPDIDFRDRHGYSPTVSVDTVRRYESSISDLAGHGSEEEDYPVVDYESDLQTNMSTTDFDEMGSKDGSSDNKLLDDFSCEEIQSGQSTSLDEIGIIVTNYSIRRIDQASRCRCRGEHASIRYFQPSTITQYVPKHALVCRHMHAQKAIQRLPRIIKEQLSTRVGYGRVHSIIENILDKCGVIASNLLTKTDDLSHSTGHGWTTREKVVNG